MGSLRIDGGEGSSRGAASEPAELPQLLDAAGEDGEGTTTAAENS